MSTVRSRRLFALVVASAVVLTSCGGSDSDSTSSGNRQRNAALTTSIRQARTKVHTYERAGLYTMALSNEDELVMWGNPTFDTNGVLKPPVSQARVAALSSNQAIAIDLDNQFHAWGVSPESLRTLPQGLDPSKVESLMLDDYVAMAIDSDGKLWGWGFVWTDNRQSTIPAEVAVSKIVDAYSYNAQINVALDDTGKVHVWGSNPDVVAAQQAFSSLNVKHIFNRQNLLGVVTTDGKIVMSGPGARPDLFPGVNIDKVSVDMYGNVLASDTDGRLYVDAIADHQDNFGPQVDDFNRWVNADSAKIRSISNGMAHFTVLLEDGEFWDLWALYNQWMDTPEYFYSSHSVSSITAGNLRTFAVSDDYRIVNFHSLQEGEVAPPSEADFLAVAAGWNHTLGLRKNGTVTSWGEGPNNNEIPGGLSPAREIGAGYGFSAVRDIYGQITDWGTFYSPFGIVKNRPDGYFYYNMMSTGFHNIIAKGYDSDDNAVIHVWGDNSYGQADVPKGIIADDVRGITVGWDCSAAVMYDGSVQVWGQCESGEKELPADTQFDIVRIGMGFAAGITFSGEVVVWGKNKPTASQPPNDLRSPVDLALGRWHIVTIDNEGGVRAWGDNVYGETFVPDSFKPLPMDDIYEDGYDDNLPDESENVDAQIEGTKNPVPTPTIVDDGPINVVKDGAVVSVIPTATTVPAITPITEEKMITMTVLPAAQTPAVQPGKVVSIAAAVKLLGLKKVTKTAFVVPKKVSASSANVCTITKTAVTIKGAGICDVKVSYTDSKKKKRTKSLALLGTP